MCSSDLGQGTGQGAGAGLGGPLGTMRGLAPSSRTHSLRSWAFLMLGSLRSTCSCIWLWLYCTTPACDCPGSNCTGTEAAVTSGPHQGPPRHPRPSWATLPPTTCPRLDQPPGLWAPGVTLMLSWAGGFGFRETERPSHGPQHPALPLWCQDGPLLGSSVLERGQGGHLTLTSSSLLSRSITLTMKSLEISKFCRPMLSELSSTKRMSMGPHLHSVGGGGLSLGAPPGTPSRAGPSRGAGPRGPGGTGENSRPPVPGCVSDRGEDESGWHPRAVGAWARGSTTHGVSPLES